MPLATGGTITYVGGYEIHTFTGSGTFTPTFSGPVQVLVIAGGGSGACRFGGGGGAGGFLYNASYSVTSGIGLTVTVGNGGAAVTESGSTYSNGNAGQNSVFDALTAIGGGPGTVVSTGVTGGSGGGSAIGSTNSGTASQGNAGGTGQDTNPYVGGGGGGAGATGGNSSGSVAGDGGIGLTSSISGTSVYYSGGGGGGAYGVSPYSGTGGSGGNGGGGAGSSNGNAINGTPNTGGGGGAAGGDNGVVSGSGGSGIVIVAFPASNDYTATPAALSLTTILQLPLINISETIQPSPLSLSVGLQSPFVFKGKIVQPSHLSLTTSLKSPSIISSSTIQPSHLSLGVSLKNPYIIIPGTNELSYASKIISYNPLIIISNTSPVKVSLVDISTPDNPIYTTYSYVGADYALDEQIDEEGNISIACADGNILQFNYASPMSYTIINTGASGNLTSLVLLETSDVFVGTDFSTGETLDMYEGNAILVGTDIRCSASINSQVGTRINTVNGAEFSTDIRCSGLVNSIVGCDIRCIDESFADLSFNPISRTDFVVYIDNIEVTDVQLESIEITHTADEKSQATFILARQHDNVDYMLDNTYFPITGIHTVKITIDGNEEFGYNTSAYIWDIDTKSQTETVKITAYSELPQQDLRDTVTVSIPELNQQLHVYHALIDNPEIDNPTILSDDINPPFYLGILIDTGYQRIQNVTQLQGLYSPSQTEDQFVNYVFGSGDSGLYDINGNNLYFKPVQNWTYFWFANATDFITGQTWSGLLPNGTSYLGTSPSSLTSKTWEVNYINFWWQRQFPDTEYRGINGDNSMYSIVYPSDFLGIISLTNPLTNSDITLGISNPFGGNTTIDQVLRDHTSTTYTGAQIQQMKERLSLLANQNATNGSNQSIITEELSTKIVDLIDSKFGTHFGVGPYKKVSCKSGILTPVPKWEDKPDGLYIHVDEGYNYKSYVELVGELEFKKIQNINGSVLPKTKCDIQLFIDGYYYYKIAVLKRINIDQTIEANIYNNNNGFPVSVKSIHISVKDMKVTLQCTNAWSRLELLEIEGQMPDPNIYVTPEKLYMIPGAVKFDPNSLLEAS